jgi:ACS family hexuronate transporter-like MFS transporter
MIVFGMTGTAVLLALVGSAHSVWPAVALMSGVVFLLYLTGGQYFLIISDTVPGQRLGGVVGFVHFIANTSGIVAPLLVGFLVDRTHSWALVFGICAGICALSVLVMLVWARRRHMQLA